MKKIVLAVCVLAATIAMPAKAAVHFVKFKSDGPWANFGSPFGLGTDAIINGSFYVDDTIGAIDIGGNISVSKDAFSNLSYTTGTKTWVNSDLGDFVGANFSGGNLILFSFGLNSTLPGLNTGGFVSSNNTISIQDGFRFINCNNCVQFSSTVIASVPEPQTWAMMLFGFAMAGAGLRTARLRQAAVA